MDRGFVLSDHADWPGLLEVIKGTEAEVVKLTHGNGDVLARYLQEMGINASVLNEKLSREGGRVMKLFSQLFHDLDGLTKTNERLKGLPSTSRKPIRSIRSGLAGSFQGIELRVL